MTWPPDWEPTWNLAPTDQGIVVRPKDDGGLRGDLFRFGLAPWWSKPKGPSGRWLNARVEGVATSRAFRQAFALRRCLVPTNGFYEWSGPKGRRVPHWITVREQPLYAMAGIWERARLPDGTELFTFAVLTCPPNDVVAPLHDRMPVILRPRDYARWLTPADVKPDDVADLLVPYPAQEMAAQVVSPLVSNVANDGPELLVPQTRQPKLFDVD